eukprot:1160814-Pelagomonas_calceolata.AAC.5
MHKHLKPCISSPESGVNGSCSRAHEHAGARVRVCACACMRVCIANHRCKERVSTCESCKLNSMKDVSMCQS